MVPDQDYMMDEAEFPIFSSSGDQQLRLQYEVEPYHAKVVLPLTAVLVLDGEWIIHMNYTWISSPYVAADRRV